MDKTYLGDGVYGELCDYGVRLTTENGIEITNEIYLEIPVIDAFLTYLKFIGWLPKERKNARLIP